MLMAAYTGWRSSPETYEHRGKPCAAVSCWHISALAKCPMRAEKRAKAVAAGLVAAHDARVLRQAQAPLRLSDLLPDPGDIPSGDGPFAWWLRHANREAELPGLLPQFKGQGQGGLGESILRDPGRDGSCHRLTPSCKRLLKELNSRGWGLLSSPT
jgi:hypothetical protein